MTFFASPAVQPTPGSRGKSTRRRSTKTVRGNDGAYCAMVKQELLARPAWTAFQVRSTTRYADGRVQSFASMRCADRATAEQYVADYLARNGRYMEASRRDHGTVMEFAVEEVTVRWEWVRGDVREVVQDGKGEPVFTFPEA
jgi:hypothetical protein